MSTLPAKAFRIVEKKASQNHPGRNLSAQLDCRHSCATLPNLYIT